MLLRQCVAGAASCGRERIGLRNSVRGGSSRGSTLRRWETCGKSGMMMNMRMSMHVRMVMGVRVRMMMMNDWVSMRVGVGVRNDMVMVMMVMVRRERQARRVAGPCLFGAMSMVRATLGRILLFDFVIELILATLFIRLRSACALQGRTQIRRGRRFGPFDALILR